MIAFLTPQTSNDYFYLMGNAAIFLFGMLLFRVTSNHWWCRYGREALACAASFIVLISGLRFAVNLAEALTLPNAAVINGFSALAFLTIMCSIVYLHRTYHRVAGEHYEP